MAWMRHQRWALPLLIALVALPGMASAGAECSKIPDSRGLGGFFSRLGDDFTSQAAAPWRFAREEPFLAAMTAATLGSVLRYDHHLLPDLVSSDDWLQRDDRRAAKWFSEYGKAEYTGTLVLGLGVWGYAASSPHEVDTLDQAARAMITTTAWTWLLKLTAARERPYHSGGEPAKWSGTGRIVREYQRSGGDPSAYYSFPSGHASAIFALATVLALNYPDYYIVPALAYGFAGAVAWSRLAMNEHWPGDVLAGAALGTLCAVQVHNASNATHEDQTTGTWLYPRFGQQSFGVGMVVVF